MQDYLRHELIEKAIEHLQGAEYVLIGAGAGLSAAAGVDYGDTATFERLFKPLMKRGFRRQYELIGFEKWSPEEKWAYWATHVNHVRFDFPPNSMYQALLDIVKDKNYFVITTNVDAMFEKAGFDTERLYTPQGDYALMQCVKACTDQTWSSKPIIDRILPHIDRDTLTITDVDVVPTCPNCGGQVFLNVRLSRYFVEKPYAEQAKKFNDWISQTSGKSVHLMEFGVGYNTPSIIRYPFENLTHSNPLVRLLRVNPDAPEVPAEIKDRSISIAESAKDVIEAMCLFGGNVS